MILVTGATAREAGQAMNVTTQEEQVAVFGNAAAHLVPGGRFVLEVGIPAISGLPSAELGRVFDLSSGHVGIDRTTTR